jgi:hypothetical protein
MIKIGNLPADPNRDAGQRVEMNLNSFDELCCCVTANNNRSCRFIRISNAFPYFCMYLYSKSMNFCSNWQFLCCLMSVTKSTKSNASSEFMRPKTQIESSLNSSSFFSLKAMRICRIFSRNSTSLINNALSRQNFSSIAVSLSMQSSAS